MVLESEGQFVLSDGTSLFEKTWEPSSPPRAHLIFLHGFSDRSEIQYHLFPTLSSEPFNIACHAIDQRGWGKSVVKPSQRGLTGPTTQVLSDIKEYINHVATQKVKNLVSTPLFIMGHSMGGQQVLHYLLSTSPPLTTSRGHLSGAIVEAPYVALDPSSQPSTLLVIAGKLAALVSPKSQMKQDLDSRYITRDPEVNAAWRDDPLCHDYGTLEGLRDMLDRGDRLVRLGQASRSQPVSNTLGLSRRLPVPVFWAHGTEDRITAFAPSERLFGALDVDGDKEMTRFKAYEGAYHKIHAEPDGVGVAFARDVGEWVLETAGGARRSRDIPVAVEGNEREALKAKL